MTAAPLYEPEDGEAKVATFMPVGPVAERFINDRKFISTIMGPYGSAKTTSCFQKILNCVCWQSPSPVDGVRRIRVCVIRATYSQLETNVMADWFSWFEKTDKNYNGELKNHKLRFEIPGLDGPGTVAVVEIEMLFRALGERKAEEIFKGMAITLLWLNEVDTLDLNVLKFGLPRVGRYPQAKDGGCQWSGIIADMNAPDIDNWTYELLVETDRPLHERIGISEEQLAELQAVHGAEFDIAFHRQPGGRTPEAENLSNLQKGYYERMLIGLNDNEIRRFVDNEFGAVNNGQPVYPEFIDRFHMATTFLKPIPGLPINFGLDGGSTPALVAGQESDDGQIRVLGELVIFNPDASKTLEKMGSHAFGEEARRWVNAMFPNAKLGEVWGDEAAFYGGFSDKHEEDIAWVEGFSKTFRLKVKPAPGTKGNRIGPRIEAVRHCLTHNVGNKPGIIFDPRCRHLRRGMNNGYIIQRVKYSSGGGRWKDVPDKNDFSHAQDGLQSLVLGLRKRGQVLDTLDRREQLRRARAHVSYGDDYFSGRGDGREAAQLRREMARERRVGRAR
jgi:hypothetical protein